MKCPKCQNENNVNAKFCVKCGCRLEAAAPAPAPQGNLTCAKCGAVLKPGSKFCVKCGTPVASREPEEGTMFLYGPGKNDTDERTVVLDTGSVNVSPAPVQTPPPQVVTGQDDIVPPVRRQEETAKKEKKEKSGSGVGLIIAASILGVASIAGIVAQSYFSCRIVQTRERKRIQGQRQR